VEEDGNPNKHKILMEMGVSNQDIKKYYSKLEERVYEYEQEEDVVEKIEDNVD
jgi:hypothetical protein